MIRYNYNFKKFKLSHIACLHFRFPSGQFGEVFRATLHKGTPGEVVVAVKTTKKNPSEKDKDDFMKEMAVMSHILHPNIVRLYGLVVESECLLALCTHTYTYTHMQVYTSICTHIYAHAHTHVCAQTCTYIHLHGTHRYTHSMYTHIWYFAYTCIWMCVCQCVHGYPLRNKYGERGGRECGRHFPIVYTHTHTHTHMLVLL